MKTEVLFFGVIADIVGLNKLELSNCIDTSSLEMEIKKEYPKLTNYKFVMAVHKNIITENTILKNGDVVAFLPPFAGG